MEKYLIILTAPSLHLINEPPYYTEPYVLSFKKGTSLETIGNYVEEKLMRNFCMKYSIALADVRISAAARLK